MTIFHKDSPIWGDEKSPDLLNREGFSESIGEAFLLDDQSQGLVVSLESKWGYGKTSTINLVNKFYKSIITQKRPIVVNFNPWMVGNAENLVQEFLVQLGSSIGLSSKAKNTQEAAKELLSYSKIFTVLKWVPGAEPWAGIVEKVIAGVGSAAEKIGELKDLNLEQQKESVVTALIKVKKPIVVFIDDLDRLPPSDVFQMIRAIKAIADFPKTTLVLAFERQYVEEALTAHGIKDANSYLEKIIQVRLHLPIISEKDLHSLAVNELEKLSPTDLTNFFKGDKERLSEIYHFSVKPLFRSPREIKRIFNRLRFAVPTTRGNVCFSDLFALEVIAIKAPQIYDHIRSNIAAYTGTEPDYKFSLEKPEEIISKYAKEREVLITSLPSEDRIYIIELLNKLFPLINSNSFESSDSGYYYANGQVASTERLLFALSFGVPTGEISSRTIESFISDPTKREEIEQDIINNGSLERFIELIERNSRVLDPPDRINFLEVIAKLAESPHVKDLDEKPRDIFLLGPYHQLWWTGKNILEKIPSKDRVVPLFNLAQNPAFLTFSTYALNFILRQHGFYDEEEKVEEKLRWFTQKEINRLKKEWLKSVKHIFQTNGFFKLNDPSHVLYLLRRIDKKATQTLLQPIMENDCDLDKLAKVFGSSGRDSNKGKYAKVTEELLESLGGVSLIRDRVKKRVKNKEIKDMALKAIYNSILTGEGYYLADNSKTGNF